MDNQLPQISSAELAGIQQIVGRPLTSDEAQILLRDSDLRAQMLMRDKGLLRRFYRWLDSQEPRNTFNDDEYNRFLRNQKRKDEV